MVNVVGFFTDLPILTMEISNRIIGQWAFSKYKSVAYLRLNFNLAVKSELFDGGVEEKDEREGRRENRVVVEILPPDTRPSILTLHLHFERGSKELLSYLKNFHCISASRTILW